jgi:molybdopterin-guanine dinucleotide biosynthesis protein A
MQRPHPGCPSRARKPCSGRKIGAGQAGGDALILGAVIAGGRSSRFGSDKAEALLDGKPLLDHAVAAIRPHVDAIVLVGRDRAGWLADRPRPDLGPLGGIASALHHAEAHRYERVLTIGCDMPRVPAELLEVLVERAPAYCREAPILGCWPASLSALLDAYVACDAKRAIRGWAESIGAACLDAAPLANINTPADLAAL